MPLTLVLSVSLDAALLSTRNLVLQSAGYTVVAAFSIKEAVDCFLGGDFDLVLLCQSIPTKDKDRLTCCIRASGSRIPVVSVSGKLFQHDAFADATVENEPEALLLGLTEVLVKSAMPMASAAMFRTSGRWSQRKGESRQDRASALSSKQKPLTNARPLSHG